MLAICNVFMILLLENLMFKRLALGLVIAVISLGVIFIVLNILDIAEDYRLDLPIAILNTVLFCPVAILVAYFAAKVFMFNGSPEMLGLSCAVFALGFGILLYGWLTGASLNSRIVAHDSGVLLASVMLSIGAVLRIAGRNLTKSGSRIKLIILLISCLGIIVIIGMVTWLAFRGLISFLTPVAGDIGFREIIRGIAVILYVALAIIYIRIYIKSRSNVYYWYSLGLILFASGVVFISQGALESRIAWLGRVSEYAGCICFLFSVLDAYRRRKSGYSDSRKIT
jgi:hypothetical protein